MPASNSFYKHYPNRKDWRKPYWDSRKYCKSCTAHGSCPHCREGRLRYKKIAKDIYEEMMEDYEDYLDEEP